jgi:CheY-like chemotaxis protein
MTTKADPNGEKLMLPVNVLRLTTSSPADQLPPFGRASRSAVVSHRRRSTESLWPKAGLHRILVVDDDPGILSVVVKMVQFIGYPTTAVPSAKDVLKVLDKNHHSLVIAEYDLPRMPANQLAKQIRTQHPGTRIVIMTGRCQAEISGRLEDGVVDGLLFKPFNMNLLREKIEMSHRRCSASCPT